MKPVFLRALLLSLILPVLTATPALAWDTKENSVKGTGERQKWLSIYNCFSDSGAAGCARNEHELLTMYALDYATKSNSWGIGGRRDFLANDLNASLFRPDLDKLVSRPSQSNDNSPLEQRYIPPPPHFASIPDISYTIYDWINKNELCPARPENDQQKDYCHVFGLWHGAGLNSSHFGQQASDSYQRLHATALSLARDAGKMYDATTSDAERTAHEDALREAELLALAYEATAQHFLGDRWAVGHMFDRWGAPEYNASAYGDDIGSAVMTGVFTGLIHGFESVVHEYIPDAMSSPEFRTTLLGTPYLFTSKWRFEGDDTTHDGVGDYRLADMEDGYFGKEYALRGYKDYKLQVSFQKQWVMKCMGASFGEVIRNFGTNPNGGYGVDGVELSAAGAAPFEDNCLTPWATNESVKVGWGTVGPLAASGLGAIARYVPIVKEDVNASELGADSPYSIVKNAALDSISLVKATARISWYAFWYPNGIDLAKGGLGDYGDAQPGNNYPVASYFEPENIDTLPASDPRGRDNEAISGLFNRARAGYFCAANSDYLDAYRRSTDDKERAACRLLATREYASTPSDYQGPQAEHQTGENGDRTQVRPLCEITGWTPPSSDSDAVPYHLHPGYVPWDAENNRTGAYQPDEWNLSTQSIAAWCDGVPVVDTETATEDRNRDIVARVTDYDKEIHLLGSNFGAATGELLIGTTRANAVKMNGVSVWNDSAITFTIGDQSGDLTFAEDRTTLIFIDRASGEDGTDIGKSSVGHFVLLDDLPRPSVQHVKLSRDGVVFLEYDAPADPHDPGAFGQRLPAASPKQLAYRSIDPGPVKVEITFDRAMDQTEDMTSVDIGYDSVTGAYESPTKWVGNYDLLAGDFFIERLGFATLSINGKADAGTWLDAKPSEPGDQPFEELRMAVGHVPLYVRELQVKQEGKSIYRATWIGGPDLKTAPNLTATALHHPTRALNIDQRIDPPSSGKGTIFVTLDRDVGTPPDLSIGGVAVTLTGKGQKWQGTFDFAAAKTGEVDGRIPIRITKDDGTPEGLDGDPRSVTEIGTEDWNGTVWTRYEDKRGGEDTGQGGADTWHYLAKPVDLSLVIILDASGSMGDDTGRMEMAKSGILQTLSQLPADKTIEAGAVVFYGCGNFDTYNFTQDIPALSSYLSNVYPDAGTPLAEAHGVAGKMFDDKADPAANEWRFATFTDGEETCAGNVAGAISALDHKIAEHRGVLRNRPPDDPPPVKPAEQMQCNPATWRGYDTDVSGSSSLPTVSLTEHWFVEQVLADGRCYARLENKKYYIYYGSGPAASGWRINSQPSETGVEYGVSTKGEADVQRVRDLADDARYYAVDLTTAKQQIDDALRPILEAN